jgi:hypothetical protein
MALLRYERSGFPAFSYLLHALHWLLKLHVNPGASISKSLCHTRSSFHAFAILNSVTGSKYSA